MSAVQKRLPIREYLESHHITFEPDQIEYIVDVVEGDTHVANWSDAGSGKSLCLEVIKDYLGDELLICATTGISNAILFNMSGGDGTCHRVFSMPLQMHTKEDLVKINRFTKELLGDSSLVRFILVEEAGMLDPDKLAVIFSRITRFNKATTKRSKRNIKLILQGDFLQVDAVKKKPDRLHMIQEYGSHYLYDSSIYQKFSFSFHSFLRNKRTGHVKFTKFLQVLRYGVESHYEIYLNWMNSIAYGTPAPEGSPLIATRNDIVDEENQRVFNLNPNVAVPYPLCINNVREDFEFNTKNCAVDEYLELKIGLPVITLINDQDGRYHNGSFGHVVDCTNAGVLVQFAASGEQHLIEWFLFEEKEMALVTNIIEEKIQYDYVVSQDVLDNGLLINGVDTTGLVGGQPLVILRGSDMFRPDHQIKTVNSDASVRVDISGFGYKLGDKLTSITTYQREVESMEKTTVASAFGIPLKIAAAFSVHRMQGRTLDVPAWVDLGQQPFGTLDPENDWGVAMAYVALSRFTHPSLIHLKYPLIHGEKASHIKVNRSAIDWLAKQKKLAKEKKGLEVAPEQRMDIHNEKKPRRDGLPPIVAVSNPVADPQQFVDSQKMEQSSEPITGSEEVHKVEAILPDTDQGEIVVDMVDPKTMDSPCELDNSDYTFDSF